MEKYIYDETNGLWYELQGDYYIPCLALPAEEEQPVGLWGQRHLHYLKEYRRGTYINLLTSGRLNAYLAEIDKQAQERFEWLIEYLTRWGPGLLRLGAIMSFGGYCVSRPGLLRLGAVVG
jgi:hypothetical protein